MKYEISKSICHKHNLDKLTCSEKKQSFLMIPGGIELNQFD